MVCVQALHTKPVVLVVSSSSGVGDGVVGGGVCGVCVHVCVRVCVSVFICVWWVCVCVGGGGGVCVEGEDIHMT